MKKFIQAALQLLRKNFGKAVILGSAAGLVTGCGGGNGETDSPPTVPELRDSIELAFRSVGQNALPPDVEESFSICVSEPVANGYTVTEIIDDGCRETGRAVCDVRRSERHWPDDLRDYVERALSNSKSYAFARLDDFSAQGEITVEDVTAKKNAIEEELCPPYWPN